MPVRRRRLLGVGLVIGDNGRVPDAALQLVVKERVRQRRAFEDDRSETMPCGEVFRRDLGDGDLREFAGSA